jgi:hypothetical protein
LGFFAGDALAMPVHWYYDLDNLRKAYGAIRGYTKPQDHMEGGYIGKM